MNVRGLGAGHAQAMADIHAQSFDTGWPALDMAVHIKRDLCLGAGEPLCAFGIFRSSDVDAEILTIATDPSHLRQGHAQAILNAAFEILSARGLKTLFLEVAEDNAPAIALYRARGFEAIGRRPNYYRRAGGRMAALTFSKRLDAPASKG